MQAFVECIYHSAIMFCYLILSAMLFNVSLSASSVPSGGTLNIAAFNIQVLGQTKMSKPHVVKYLVKMILRYHVILIQEIRDSKQTAIIDLLNQVHQVSAYPYKMVVSPRLGRTSSKEQYAYMYRSDLIQIKDTYIFADPNDFFEREPYLVKLTSPLLDYEFVMVGIHTSPDDAQKEVNHLYDVYLDVIKRWNLDQLIFLGDFNAACNYVSDWSQIRMANDPKFYWLITDAVDTTTGQTECAYDRIITFGNEITSAVDPTSPKAFRYDKFYGLNQVQSLDISDHYPVEIGIRTSVEMKRTQVTTLYDVRDQSQTSMSKTYLFGIRRVALGMAEYTVHSTYTNTGATESFQISRTAASVTDALPYLDALRQHFPAVVSNLQLEIGKRHMQHLVLSNTLPISNDYHTLANFYSGRKTKVTMAVVSYMMKEPIERWLILRAITSP